MQGTWENPTSKLVKAALESAVQEQVLPTHISLIIGMSGLWYREFINKLIKSMPDPRYLEIGSWSGSTACSAIYRNKLTATCIDNWSEFGGPRDEFFKNIESNTNKNVNFSFIESDFRQVDYAAIGTYNVYLFDGPHEYQDQKDGITIAQPALDDTYVLIVDDYNWEKVREGTLDGIKDLGHTIVDYIEIRTTEDNSHPHIPNHYSNWHNGYFIAVISKNSKV